MRGGGVIISNHTCPQYLDVRLDKNGGQFSTRRLLYSGLYCNRNKFAVEQVGVSELDSLRSSFAILVLNSTMRCSTSMMMSELVNVQIKARGLLSQCER